VAAGRSKRAHPGREALPAVGLREVRGEAKREVNRVARNLILGWDWGKWTCDLCWLEYQL
jgi:hypothetical protein